MKFDYLTQFPAVLRRPNGSVVGAAELARQIVGQISGGYGRVPLLAEFVLPNACDVVVDEHIQPFPIMLVPSPNGRGYILGNQVAGLVLEDLLQIASNKGLGEVTVVVHKQYLEKRREK